MNVKNDESERLAINNIKLKDRLDIVNQKIFINTENPVQRLNFYKSKFDDLRRKTKLPPYSLWFSLVVAFLISTSILLNSYFMEKIDPAIVMAVNSSVNFFYNQINKPYVITIGEFSNFDKAKSKAIELLPKLRQINIKKINGGMYTFEIEKLSSKEKAYSLAKQFTDSGFETVHVRYLTK